MGRETSVSGATDGYPGGSGGGTAYRAPAVGYGYNPSTPSPIVPSIPASHPYGITQGYPSGATSTTNTYGSGGVVVQVVQVQLVGVIRRQMIILVLMVVQVLRF